MKTNVLLSLPRVLEEWVVWPSGLRRWFKAPISSEAWVRISVALYALYLHPLIRALEDSLPCIKIGRNSQHGPVIAYADDVTVFVTYPKDFQVIKKAIQLYERATGAQLNPNKSKALAIMGLDRTTDSPGHTFPRTSQYTRGGIQAHNRHLHAGQLDEDHMCGTGPSKTGIY